MIIGFDVICLCLILLCAILALYLKDLMGAVIVFGAYSFLMCVVWACNAAIDVAFTEASVGAGISTILFLAALSYLPKEETEHIKSLFRKFDAIYASANELQTRLRKSLCARTHPRERARAR